jgi:hypothetical protein
MEVDMSGYTQWLNDLSLWLDDIKNHELNDLITKFIKHQERFSKHSKEALQDYRYFLSRDIEHLKHHQQHYDDLAWQELKASVLSQLSYIEDKTQLEWQAILQDFQHDGTYKQGEWIAIGQLVCKNCGSKVEVLYVSEVHACEECGHSHFKRVALSP